MKSYYRTIFTASGPYMFRNPLAGISVAVAYAILSTALADSPQPPLFVSISGTDSGDCKKAATPCRTIDYALGRVGKNGQILVGKGSFELAAIEDVVYLLSGAIDVRGSGETTLIGVPHEFAAELGERGFHVIADAKGMSHERSVASQKIVETQISLQSNAAATDCVGGMAGVFPCDNVDLLAHISDRTPGARGADIWGFMDLNTNREYAIVGYSSGTAVFDVTNAENPREVGFINGQLTTWRDIKVYQFWNAIDARWNAYAYVTADNASDGLFIINLSNLPHSINRISYSSDFAAAHNVYLADVEFSTGLSISGESPTLILAGANRSDGRFRGYTLATPASPAFVAAPSTPADQIGGDRLYMHDAASMIVTDSRKDTQCVNASASDHCDVLFDFNESTVDIWDITNPASPVRLSQSPYTNSRYTHSGWWTEDQQFMFVQDELDERDRGLLTTLRVFSIADLTSPTLVGNGWTGPTNAIDHNGFVRGNRYYMSNYARGLTILDITNAASPLLAGRFDTFPSSDGVGFPGNWGAYPYLPSGNIALSDIDSGFYMVADKTLDVVEGTLTFAARSFGNQEAQSATISVQRTGGSQGAASVGWELIPATGSSDDVTVTSGDLNWADGDSATKTINLDLTNDGSEEGLERFLIRLIAPTGGVTLSSPNLASVYVSDPGATSAVEFLATTISIAERGYGTAVAVAHRSGSAVGAMVVDYSVTAGDATAGSDYTGPASGTLNWADGDADPKWIEYAIIDDGSPEADEFLELSLTRTVGNAIVLVDQLRIDILDGDGANNAPNSVAGANQTVNVGATVILDGTASNDPDGDQLSYLWTQTLGPTVSISSASSESASFTAPSVSSDTMMRFQLEVTDPGGQTNASMATITVRSGATGGSGGGGGVINIWLLVALFGLSAIRRAINRMGVS